MYRLQKACLPARVPGKEIPSMLPIPWPPWFLAAYVRDVMTRLEEVKATITNTFGSILKMDSTK